MVTYALSFVLHSMVVAKSRLFTALRAFSEQAQTDYQGKLEVLMSGKWAARQCAQAYQ